MLRSGHRWIELGGDDGRQSRLRLGWLDDSRRGRRPLAAGRRQGRSAEDNVLLFGRWVVRHGWNWVALTPLGGQGPQGVGAEQESG